MKLHLQQIVESIKLETLPTEWQSFNFTKFSEKKDLFDYQQKALENALKALYLYYDKCKQDKKEFYKIYVNNELAERLDFDLNNRQKQKIFEEYSSDYTFTNNRIEFYHFINRMSFWMATGSGKTLVIVKLIELLSTLIKNEKQIPSNEILFLTYRDDLIDQFVTHIKEFNQSSNSVKINLYSLKDYEKVKRSNKIVYPNEIDVFYYRSDLISDEQKDKIIDFRNYDNYGKWYIILDEAHKGEKEDSKRQIYYSILSRNGFLFNFSATFTEQIDYTTCVYNFNLEQFITQGYGKQIFLPQTNINELGLKIDFSETQKQIIIIKILLLHTYIRKNKPEKYYHNPLIVVLVNSVNTEDADLYLFFKELEKIALGEIKEELLTMAKEELLKEINGRTEFTDDKIELDQQIKEITWDDIYRMVFNTDKNGKIEVLKIPNNKQEIVFKLVSTDKPFALIKIGDISEWLKNKLTNYEIIERYDNESIFKNISNDDSDINILMGSRSFYEGWDSVRPAIILYINIGKGINAQKFILQSLGRGIRIEPISNQRRRLKFLYNNKIIDKNEFETIHQKAKLSETLFVFGTKAENIRQIINTLKIESQEENLGDLFDINPEIYNKPLLIPTFKDSDKMLIEEFDFLKFEIHPRDYELTRKYFNYIGENIALVKYEIQPKLMEKIKFALSSTTNNNYCNITENSNEIGNPSIILRKMLSYFSTKTKHFNDMKELANEIIHFKFIKISKDKLNNLKETIQKVKNYHKKNEEEKKIDNLYIENKVTLQEYKVRLRNLDYEYQEKVQTQDLHIRYLHNHYYIPIVITENEKIDYIKHIIKTKSEYEFINQLEKHLQSNNPIEQKKYDWWFFSKIDEHLDEVYIPYFQAKTNKLAKFKPDFIFWIKKGSKYQIVFVDPKGIEHTDAQRKIDGFERYFSDKKHYVHKNEVFNISVSLYLFVSSKNKCPEKYKNFCIDSIYDLFEAIDKNFTH